MKPNAELIAALRRHFFRHNLQVLALTLLTFATAAVLWAMLYGFVYWVLLFGISAARGLEAEMPAAFTKVFLLVAAALLSIAWIDRKLRQHDHPRDDKSFGAHLADILLAIPRVTLAISANLSAWQRLRREELILAAALLERVAREEKIEFQSTPLDIPEDARREKIILALLLSRALEFRREEGISWLTVSSAARDELRLGAESAHPRLPEA